MTAQRRRWLLGLCVLLTVALAWFAPQEDAPVMRPSTNSRSQRVAQPTPETSTERSAPLRAASGPMRQEQLTRQERLFATEATDLFKATSWYVPPPAPPPLPPPPPPQPPKPTAPALPFSFLGQIIENEQTQVILARGERVVMVLVGDSIDKNYRLESLKGGVLTFLYLPLDTRQTLATGITP